MAKILSDQEIRELFSERKPLRKRAVKKLKRLTQKSQRPDKRSGIKFRSITGRKYRLIVRQNASRDAEFSVIFQLLRPRAKPITLVRCNGHHAPHRNWIEGTLVPADTCHIHTITERYQRAGRKPEYFAEQTDQYRTCDGAINFISWHFGMFVQDEDSGGLFASKEHL